MGLGNPFILLLLVISIIFRVSCRYKECGGVVCKTYEVCCGDELCCDKGSCCGSKCCLDNEKCLMFEITDDTYSTICCKNENTCNEHLCCKDNQKCCDKQCCGLDQCCFNGEHCCPLHKTCCKQKEKESSKSYKITQSNNETITHLCCDKKSQFCCKNNMCCQNNQICCDDECCHSNDACADYINRFNNANEVHQKCVKYDENKGVLPSKITNSIYELYMLPMGDGDATIVKCLKGRNKGNLLLIDFMAENDEKKVWKIEELKRYVKELGIVKNVVINAPKSIKEFSYVPFILDDPDLKKNISNVFISGKLTTNYQGIELGSWLMDKSIIEKVREINGGNSCFGNTCFGKKIPNIFPCGNLKKSEGKKSRSKGKVEILSANTGKHMHIFGDGNLKNSILLKLSYHKFSALFFTLYDGEEAIEDMLISIDDHMNDVSFMKLPNHCDRMRKEFDEVMEISNPEVVFCSNGYGFSFTPKCEIINKILEHPKRRLRTLINKNSNVVKKNIFQCTDGKSKVKSDNWLYHLYTSTPRMNENYILKLQVNSKQYSVDYYSLPEEYIIKKETSNLEVNMGDVDLSNFKPQK